jgi:hypothetical protein
MVECMVATPCIADIQSTFLKKQLPLFGHQSDFHKQNQLAISGGNIPVQWSAAIKLNIWCYFTV